ncbi:hypothetical protein Tco_1099160 [Tanacetum coccineum]
MQSPSLQPPPKSSSQLEGEHIKEDKGKKALSLKEVEKESTDSDSDNETHKIKEEAKDEAARREGEIRKEELIELLGLEVVNKYYNEKLQYDKYCEKMLNRRAKSRITNCDIFTEKGQITLKVYREDDTSEIIPKFKADDLHLGEWREVVIASPPQKKGKGWTSIYKQIQERMDYLRTTEAGLGINFDRPLTNKRLKSSVQYKDHPAGTKLKRVVSLLEGLQGGKKIALCQKE